jgi:hypothetical protein
MRRESRAKLTAESGGDGAINFRGQPGIHHKLPAAARMRIHAMRKNFSNKAFSNEACPALDAGWAPVRLKTL